MRPLRVLGVALVVLAVTAVPLPARAANYVYLAVVLHGSGSGSVKSLASDGGSPDGWIDCRMVNGYVDPREVCDQQFDGGDDSQIRIYYRVAPAPGSCMNVGGSCFESGYSTYIDVTSEQTLTFTFNPVLYHLDVLRSGNGAGTVTSSDGSISCGLLCEYNYDYGIPLTLTATPQSGSYFAGWADACAGQDATCDLTMTSAKAATATFQPGNPPTPLVSPAVTPNVTAGATSVATPKVTAAATTAATPRASGTGKPTTLPTAIPGSSPGASVAGASGQPATASDPSAGSIGPGGTIEPPTGPPGPGESEGAGPVDPASSGSAADLTPIILAILGAGLFIAIGIGFAAVWLRRQSSGVGGRGSSPPAA